MKNLEHLLILPLLLILYSGYSQCGSYTTSQVGDYFTSANWVNGLLPPNPIPSGLTVDLVHNMTISGVLENNGTIDATGSSLTIEGSGSYGGIGNFNGDIINNGLLSPGVFTMGTIDNTLAGITTEEVTAIMETSATSGGEICYDGGVSVTARGICYSTSMNPTTADNPTLDGSGIGSYSSSLTGLSAGTTYYVRAYATNTAGTSYGQEKSFTTAPTFSVPTITIGTQTWMANNLDVGTMITGTTNMTNNSTLEKYCYNDLPANCVTYGALYQWDEMMQYTTLSEPHQGICPTGFHLPTDTEWKTLEKQLGMSQLQADATGYRGTDEGSQLAGNEPLWTNGSLDQNGMGTPPFGTSGFAALSGGFRNTSGSFINQSIFALYWSSPDSGGNAWNRGLFFNIPMVYRDVSSKSNGFSVRCVQD